MPRYSAQAPHDSEMESRLLRIDSQAALAQFRASLLLPTPRRSDIRIVLKEEYLGADAKGVEHRVNKLYADCGCEAGGLAVVLAIVGLAAWWGLSHESFDWSFSIRALTIVGIAAVIGKFIGLMFIRIILFRILLRLERRPDNKNGEVT